MTFKHEQSRYKKRSRPDQHSTPLKVAQNLARLMMTELDIKDKIVFEPCVGTGNLLLPLIGKGAILIGNDIDREALEICQKRIPEAILTNCNTLICYIPSHNKNLKYGLYCSEHLYQEPPETLLRLEKIIQKRQLQRIQQLWTNLTNHE